MTTTLNEQLNIHENIKLKLKYFYDIRKIPNLLFNGLCGTGKSRLVNDFIHLIYNNNTNIIKNFVMYVNCAHGKGIKFIREELKLFAKTHINSNCGETFKTIVLFNGDKLTIDAQSALRRCIELFSHDTRFFIIVEDKNKLLKPILSRFCEIYVPQPTLNGITIDNLHKYNNLSSFNTSVLSNNRLNSLKDYFEENDFRQMSALNICNFVSKMYEDGYSALDFIKLIDNDLLIEISVDRKYELLFIFEKIKSEFRNEKLLMFFIINFIYLDQTTPLENITFM
jgi:hypothetical protein